MIRVFADERDRYSWRLAVGSPVRLTFHHSPPDARFPAMTSPRRPRLDPEIFNLPVEKMRLATTRTNISCAPVTFSGPTVHRQS